MAFFVNLCYYFLSKFLTLLAVGEGEGWTGRLT